MFVFIHGTLATPSLWLPQIRAILSLGREYSDRELINTFALELPGHPGGDKTFTFKDFKAMVESFQQLNYPKQQEIARKMLLHGDKNIVQALQDKKLIIIGHSVGGALSLEYSLKNSSNIKKLILVSTPARFNIPYLYSIDFVIKTLSRRLPKLLKVLFKILPFRRWRVGADLLIRNPKQKGFSSCISYLKDYDFAKLYQISSLNQHLALSRIPILLIGGGYDFVAMPSSVKRLNKILTDESEIISTKKTVINGQKPTQDPVLTLIYASGHNPMDSRLVEFCADARNFLFES